MFISRWLTLSAFFFACLIFTPRTPAASPPDPALSGQVRTIVAGIVSYTRWPQLQGLPKLCIFSTAAYAAALGDKNSDISFQPQIVKSADEALNAQCDGLYFGNESPQQQLQLIERYQTHPLLLIAEQNPQCIIGSAFCLNIHNDAVSFSVNLDALARSGVRVSPDVLLLARPGNKIHE
ncbi:YfiR family protein [Cedecea davisae]|uniref:YfiR family protein n=1 Tax=Cedecea davisae TaxID=158484 RepID=A0ABS6DB17_9ENTR|nr:YfiR family protein [Cedecea davisae]MBU4680411.1 YfiR family protein [Cedecea davisae]MBU4684903.1 YfiR family protein [Cedecea davisae]